MRARSIVMVGVAVLAACVDAPPADTDPTPTACAALQPAPLHRVSGRQLGWMLHDLIGADPAVAAHLPPDPVTSGFDVLTVSQRIDAPWVAAATLAIDAAVTEVFESARIDSGFDVDPAEADGSEEVPELERTFAVFNRAAVVSGEVTLPVAGRWLVDLEGYEVILHVDGEPFEDADPAASVEVDGVVRGRTVFDRQTYTDIHHPIPVTLSAGTHVVRVELQPSDTRYAALGRVVLRPDPDGGPALSSPALDALIPCNPRQDERCVADALGALVRRAWRRETDDATITSLTSLVAQSDDPYDGLAIAVAAVLYAPDAMFLVEAPGQPGGRPLDAWEVAGRLATVLWESVPDDALVACAIDGGLGRDDTGACGLDAQIDRMLADPKASRFFEAFGRGWMSLDALTDPSMRGSDVDPALAASMTEALVASLRDDVTGNAPLADLLDDDEVWADATLAALYGVSGPVGDEPVRIPAPEHRGGLLREPAFLVSSADPGRTSPTRRGKVVLERFLCAPPPNPPDSIPPLPDVSSPADVEDALRQHLSNPACAACHAGIDPVGLALDGFGQDGLWRGPAASFEPLPMPDGTLLTDDEDLTAWVGADPRFASCLASNLGLWALQRVPDEADLCAIDAALGSTTTPDTRLGDLLQAVLHADAFLKRAADPEAP